MNRKFRELIPLFAIALMIIAAVAFLIIINQDGSKKKKTTEVKENTKVEEKTSDEEVSKPFAEQDEFSAEDEEETKTESETKVTTSDVKVTTNTKVDTTTTTNAGKDSSYKNQINKLVDNALAGTATTPKIEVTTTTETQTQPVVEQKQPAAQVTTKPQPAKTTTTITAPTTASYTRYSTATVGSYQVSVCSGNKLVSFKNGVQVDAKDISSYATIESKVGSSIYVYVPGVGIRQYTIGSNGKISQQVTINNCQKYIVSGNYLYVLSNVNSVICYNLGDGSTKLAEVAVLNVIGGVNDLVSANNTKVVVATDNGNKTYYLDGAMFIAK